MAREGMWRIKLMHPGSCLYTLHMQLQCRTSTCLSLWLATYSCCDCNRRHSTESPQLPIVPGQLWLITYPQRGLQLLTWRGSKLPMVPLQWWLIAYPLSRRGLESCPPNGFLKINYCRKNRLPWMSPVLWKWRRTAWALHIGYSYCAATSCLSQNSASGTFCHKLARSRWALQTS